MGGANWEGVESEVANTVRELSAAYLENAENIPTEITAWANQERQIWGGGYEGRTIHELIQNGADEILRWVEDPTKKSFKSGGIRVVLTSSALYCANEGHPLTPEGVSTLLSNNLSYKTGNEIGRFGVGFKSVLQVTDRPEIYSATGSLGFDRGRSHRAFSRISPGSPDKERVPVLRIAEPIDPGEAFVDDDILTELADGGASTIVKLPLKPRKASGLRKDLEGFDREFLLFSPHVSSLILDDRIGQGMLREITLEVEDSSNGMMGPDPDRGETTWNGEILLTEGGNSDLHLVLTRMHQPSEAAAEANSALDRSREMIPITWAVPKVGSRELGQFWCFFPTNYETTLRGIVNAPWKTNTDRTQLLPGPFNQELLGIAAELVVEGIPQLQGLWPDDRCQYLLRLPGRFSGPEPKNWADRRISEQVYVKGSTSETLPNQDGELKVPTSLHLHPSDPTEEAVQEWAKFPGRPKRWVHADVQLGNRTDKRARAARLIKPNNEQMVPENLTTWLEALVEVKTPEASLAAMRVAAILLPTLTVNKRPEVLQAKIVLTKGKKFVPPKPGTVFIPGGFDAVEGTVYVHPELAKEANRDVLEALEIAEVSPEAELKKLVEEGFSGASGSSIWQLVRKIDEVPASEILKDSLGSDTPVRVKVVSGAWKRIDSVLLVGDVATAEEDPEVVLDEEWHAEDLGLLRRLGLADRPRAEGGSTSEPWFAEYRREAMVDWNEALAAHGPGNPVRELVQFRDNQGEERTEVFGPLASLVGLSDESKARFTRIALGFSGAISAKWRFAHSQGRWPAILFQSPLYWMLKREGRLATSMGPQPMKLCVGPQLADFGEVFPVVQHLQPAEAVLFDIPTNPGDIPLDAWAEAVGRADLLSPDRLAEFYSEAAQASVDAPDTIHCPVGEGQLQPVPTVEVHVATDEAKSAELLTEGRPCLLANPVDAEILISFWGLSPAEMEHETYVQGQSLGQEEHLANEIHGLRPYLKGANGNLVVVPCSEVECVTVTAAGSTATPITVGIQDGFIYWNPDMEKEELARKEELVRFLDDELGLELGEEGIAEVLDQEGRANRMVLVQKVRAKSKKSFEAGLLVALSADSIRRRIPVKVLELAVERFGELDDSMIIELAKACFGVQLLSKLRADFEEAGFEPPVQFAGGRSARVWVEELGFPREYAGFESASLEPLLEVDGPPDLPDLHLYQERVRDAMQELLRSPKVKRGLLCLPTGAGKTRVAVQSIVELIRDRELSGPILWVAQTQELCEQAVQTWSEIWRAKGSGDRLAVSRLWASNHVQEIPDSCQVVVATVAKLDTLDDAEPGDSSDPYGWLAEASCVIVDEAHRAMGASYNKLLRWLGLDRNKKARPLIGLTATPYKASDKATENLAGRFERRRIDDGVFEGDPYKELQELGFLAKVKHKKLPGRTIPLTPKELKELKEWRRLPTSAVAKVADDRVRNKAILDSIGKLDPEWPVLVFAASVAHAQALAAILALTGVPAVAITSETGAAARRHQIEQFRSGAIRVLTNYGVLTEGFDAPKVRAVCIARPTYSPSLYQQMIGRGLRGPMNGGEEECLIIDVEDNIDMYEGKLAFTEFEGLWSNR